MSETRKQKRKRKENPHQGFSLARPSYKNKIGRKRKCSIYHCRFKDPLGQWRRLPLFTDNQSSAAFARKIVQIVAIKSAGEPLSPELCKWTDKIDSKKLDKLVSWGVLDQRRLEVVKSLTDHLDDWKKAIQAGGSTFRNAQQRYTRAKKVLDGCDYIRFADINCLKVTAYLADMDCSKRTRNHYSASLRQFGKWMVRNSKASYSPLEGLVNVAITDDLRRRSLTIQNFTKLLRVTLSSPKPNVPSPVYEGMTGFERSTLYWLASETGYRASELRSLTASSVDLTSDPVTVSVKAGYAKNKKQSKLSITNELASRMRVLLKGKLPTAPAFKMPDKTAKMIRFDLEQAGIPYVDDAGEIFDFHALRVQCASLLIRANCNVKVIQERMRHSTSMLTLDIYSRLGQSEQDTAAVEALPKLSLRA